jgi:hypothetical protein
MNSAVIMTSPRFICADTPATRTTSVATGWPSRRLEGQDVSRSRQVNRQREAQTEETIKARSVTAA